MSGGWAGSRGGPGDVLALPVSGLIAAGLFGEVFRDDAVSGTAGIGFEVVGNLRFAPTGVDAEVVLPVFDGCTVAGARYGFAFQCSEPRSGTAGDYDPGIAAVTLADCLATGLGTLGSAAVTTGPANPSLMNQGAVTPGADTDLFGSGFGNRFQNFAATSPVAAQP